MDTSVIVDGRILALYRAGFLQGEVRVPLFVLHEIQQLADSKEYLTAKKGKRALAALGQMKNLVPPVGTTLVFSGEEYDRNLDVDDLLVQECRKYKNALLVSSDDVLLSIAKLMGTATMNLNTVIDAIRPAVLIGDRYVITPAHVSPERVGQAYGFLPDNTMVFVEGGRPYIGKPVPIVITNVIHKPTGVVAFAKLHKSR